MKLVEDLTAIEEIIISLFRQVKGGIKKVDMEFVDGATVKAYIAGSIIRVDIKEKIDIPF